MGGTTIFFDGQFWTAIAEREGDDGVLRLARHVFGPEPGTPELLHYYLHVLGESRFLPGGEPPKAKARDKRPDARASGRKALDAYKAARAATAETRRSRSSAERREADRARYEATREKRKRKKRGK